MWSYNRISSTWPRCCIMQLIGLDNIPICFWVFLEIFHLPCNARNLTVKIQTVIYWNMLNEQKVTEELRVLFNQWSSQELGWNRFSVRHFYMNLNQVFPRDVMIVFTRVSFLKVRCPVLFAQKGWINSCREDFEWL